MLKDPASISTDLSQETPPPNFNVEYHWKARAQNFDRLDFLKTIIRDMAMLAARDWNEPIAAAYCPTQYGIAVKFVSDRATPKLKVKHTLWALEDVFAKFEKQRRYGPGSMVIEVPPDRLGIGQIQAASTATNVPVQGFQLWNSTFENRIGGSAMQFQVDSVVTPIESANTSIVDTTPPNSLNSKTLAKELSISVTYRDDGQIFPDVQIFNASFKLIVRAAEPPNIHEAIGPLLSTYNDVANFTFSLVAEPFVKTNELSWLDCIDTVAGLVTEMATMGEAGQWAELDGMIKDEGVVLGRFCIDEGDVTKLDPGSLCDVDSPPEVNVS